MNGNKEFFKTHEDYNIRVTFYECTQSFTVEELYQAIKSRLLTELEIKAPDYSQMMRSYIGPWTIQEKQGDDK